MEEITKAKLIELLETLFMRNHITYEEYLKVDVDWMHDSINCLEAKPKALHSMKEAKEICTFCGSREISWYGNDDDKTFFCFDCKKVQSD